MLQKYIRNKDDVVDKLLPTAYVAADLLANRENAWYEQDDLRGEGALSLAGELQNLLSGRVRDEKDYTFTAATRAGQRYLRRARRCLPPKGYVPGHPESRLTETDLTQRHFEWIEEARAACLAAHLDCFVLRCVSMRYGTTPFSLRPSIPGPLQFERSIYVR
jgi:hypothetical protein